VNFKTPPVGLRPEAWKKRKIGEGVKRKKNKKKSLTSQKGKLSSGKKNKKKSLRFRRSDYTLKT
jgi:hypothetical protein